MVPLPCRFPLWTAAVAVVIFLFSGCLAKPIIYSTSWCEYCKSAQEYLYFRGISYIDKDVETDKAALAELTAKCLAAGLAPPEVVPYLDIHGDLVIGFNREHIDKLLKKWKYPVR